MRDVLINFLQLDCCRNLADKLKQNNSNCKLDSCNVQDDEVFEKLQKNRMDINIFSTLVFWRDFYPFFTTEWREWKICKSTFQVKSSVKEGSFVQKWENQRLHSSFSSTSCRKGLCIYLFNSTLKSEKNMQSREAGQALDIRVPISIRHSEVGLARPGRSSCILLFGFFENLSQNFFI